MVKDRTADPFSAPPRPTLPTRQTRKGCTPRLRRVGDSGWQAPDSSSRGGEDRQRRLEGHDAEPGGTRLAPPGEVMITRIGWLTAKMNRRAPVLHSRRRQAAPRHA